MRTRKEVLTELARAMSTGLVTQRDVEEVMWKNSQQETSSHSSHDELDAPRKNSVVRSLFYSAGVVMFAAVISVINQTWGSGLALHLLLTVGLGSIAWVAAYYAGSHKSYSEVRHGLSDALILTGSLLLVAGGYIAINYFGNYSRVDFFEAAPALAVLAVLHFAFYRILRRDLVYLFGMFLVVATIGAVMYGILEDSSMVADIWAIVFVGLAGLLSWSTHVVSSLSKTTRHLQGSHDKFAIFMTLFTMFIVSFGNYAALWYFALAVAICAVYYLSIINKQKILLGAASTFLVLMTVTIAFRYFSDFSLTASLLISATGILAVAALATQLSKKYITE